MFSVKGQGGNGDQLQLFLKIHCVVEEVSIAHSVVHERPWSTEGWGFGTVKVRIVDPEVQGEEVWVEDCRIVIQGAERRSDGGGLDPSPLS